MSTSHTVTPSVQVSPAVAFGSSPGTRALVHHAAVFGDGTSGHRWVGYARSS